MNMLSQQLFTEWGDPIAVNIPIRYIRDLCFKADLRRGEGAVPEEV